ncbi:hypothetical protein HF1_08190 [Mycoplasma haemofelis str. Langford 1]|uniref:Uncharacterized protein n=1 Tax=Mycoplasma haemofelis (strain Langford 1) TaxID=941640 RepID=E8ZI56_MYCHL|nr:hypothetical protein [Mycoplasma haemofelis]CBY92827.1 hypothetical protein HF1_08190 [Mycoplasma haemofelis str. Langford 1]
MPKSALLPLVGLGGAAGLGGGAYLLHKNSQPSPIEKPSIPEKKTIQDKLQKEGFQILNSSEGQHWGTLKDAYNSAKSEESKVFAVINSNIDENKLKDLCKSALEKDEEDASYSKAKRWCVVPVTVSDYLSKLGRRALSTASSGETDKDQWEKLAAKYESAPDKIASVTSLGADNNKWSTLRQKCGELGAKKNYEDNFDTNLASSKVWCSV